MIVEPTCKNIAAAITKPPIAVVASLAVTGQTQVLGLVMSLSFFTVDL
jgi:hypothetical protein